MKAITQGDMQNVLSDPQQLNSYFYARNNPIVFRDSNGQCIEPLSATICFAFTAASLAGAAAVLAESFYSDVYLPNWSQYAGGFSDDQRSLGWSRFGVHTTFGVGPQGIVNRSTKFALEGTLLFDSYIGILAPYIDQTYLNQDVLSLLQKYIPSTTVVYQSSGSASFVPPPPGPPPPPPSGGPPSSGGGGSPSSAGGSGISLPPPPPPSPPPPRFR